jgi:TPR repeat protein
LLAKGEGIAMNKSLAAHYFKLSADQGFAQAQLHYGLLLLTGEGITMNKSLAAYYFKLSADQGIVQAQYSYAVLLLEGESVQKDALMGVQYLERAAAGGWLPAQLHYANMIRYSNKIAQDARKSARYYKFATDQGSVEDQTTDATCLVHGDGVEVNMTEADRYFQLACDQSDSTAQMRYGIVLLCGLLGRFDFTEARNRFDEAASSNSFALILRDALSRSSEHIVTPEDFEKIGNPFSFMRSESDEGILVIRVMNPHLCRTWPDPSRVFSVWNDMVRSSVTYLLDLVHIDSAVDGLLVTDLRSCESISEMIPLIFKMYSIESSLYKNVNYFLRCFPFQFLRKFMKELQGVLSYIYLLQSSIDYYSQFQPLAENRIVYRGFSSDGPDLVPLYESLVGEVIIWRGFTSTSTDIDVVIERFVQNADGILFEIELHRGDVVADIGCYSEKLPDSLFLIVALSAFRVVAVEEIRVRNQSSGDFTIPKVKLSYFVQWYDFDIDAPPPSFRVV